MMSYEEVILFACKHYNEGGDGTYECLSKADYDRNVESGIVYTEEYLLADFRLYQALIKEMEASAW